MVELCELNLANCNFESQWPMDIDQHIAQLEFERSSDEDNNDDDDDDDAAQVSLFSSMALVDPSSVIISTDSLDMEKLHAQCEVNKNEYKLTFEDSGQWTSGGNLTTWGRIHSAEPLDEKTNSLPELGSNAVHTVRENVNNRRPSSLLSTFVGRQPLDTTTDWYAGNGRYVDVNDNEVEYLSPNNPTADAAHPQHPASADRWRRAAVARLHLAPVKPHRTFADFQAQRAPQLDFMQMDHTMPSICQSSTSFSDLLDRLKEGVLEDDQLDFSVLNTLEKRCIGPDSGLGSSASASSGPIHIEDWPSLAILLPKHVAEACSFFKNNSRLLTGSNSIERAHSRRAEACRTCFSIRRRLHPPIWAQPSSARYNLCDCATSEILDRRSLSSRDRLEQIGKLKVRAQELSIVGLPIYDSKRRLVEKVVEGVAMMVHQGSPESLCTALESLIADGLRIDHPWEMISKITAPGVATNSIYSLVKELDNSEKSQNSRVTTFFTELLRLGTIDCWMGYVVLKETALASIYFDGAFMLRASTAYRSLLWRLLENLELLALLERSGTEPGEAAPHRNLASPPVPSANNTLMLGASQLASDSRVPKSSSMPSRLSTESKPSRCDDAGQHSTRPHSDLGGAVHILRRSRIPTLGRQRPERARSSGTAQQTPLRPTDTGTVASATVSIDQPGMLKVLRGERLRVLSTRGPMARCYRLHRRRDCVMQGLIPTANLVFLH